MTTNADLIAEAAAWRGNAGAGDPYVLSHLVGQLADALEASEAQVERLEEQGHAYLEEAARLMAHLQRLYDATDDAVRKAEIEAAIIGDEWPADLLAAVRHLGGDFPPKTTYNDRIRLRGEAVATLVRYGLLKEAR